MMMHSSAVLASALLVAGSASAPWECHKYSGGQENANWCATAGVQDGIEYRYSEEGVDSPCAPCWCCQRPAEEQQQPSPKKSAGGANASHTLPTESPTRKMIMIRPELITSSEPQATEESNWVISDLRDEFLGNIVPRRVVEDPKLFTGIGDHAVAFLAGKPHFATLETRKVPIASGDCDGNPCEASVADGFRQWATSFADKYLRIRPHSFDFHWSRTLASSSIPAAILFVLAFTTAGAFGLRRWKGPRQPGASVAFARLEAEEERAGERVVQQPASDRGVFGAWLGLGGEVAGDDA